MDEQSCKQLFHLPEYAYKTNMLLTKKGLLNVLKIVVALLNTSGGILLVENTSNESMKSLDNWRGKLVDLFAKVIQSNVIMPHIEIDSDLKVIYILVASTSALVTYDYHMHDRSISATTQKVTNDEKCATIIKQDIVHRDAVRLTDIPYGHSFTRLETMNMEFKNIPNSEALTNRIRTSQDRIQKCLLAFPNTPGGGDLIFGLEEQEHQYRVEGNYLTEENKKLICTAVDEVFTGGQESPRIWADTNSKTPNPKLWSVNFVRLLDQPSYLTHISVNQFKGGFFRRSPECYYVSDIGVITNLGFSEWKSRLLKIDPEEIKSPDGMGDAEIPPVPAGGNLVLEPHQKEERTEFTKENQMLNELTINEKLEKKQSVSSKETGTFWRKAVTGGDIPTSVKGITFTCGTKDVKGKSYIPPTESVLHSICAEIKEHERSAQLKRMFEIALKTIEQEITEDFVGFPQRHWKETLIPDDSKHFSLNNVVMDLVILTKQRRILFWSIVSEIHPPCDEDNCRMYALQVCRLLKKRMLQSLSAVYTPEKARVKFTIKPYLYNMEKHQIMNILTCNCIPDLLLESMESFFGPCIVPAHELKEVICVLLHKELTDMYRNSQVVCSFTKANATKSHRSLLKGDDAIVQEIKNADSEGSDNGLLEVLDDTLGHQNDSQFTYAAKDVTVLADTEKRCQFFRKLLKKHRPELKVQPAGELPVNGVVLDTADNFWGLETKVCFFIASKPGKKGSAKHGIHNEKFFLFLASRAVYKVVLLLPYRVTSDMARRLQMDDFSVLLQGETNVDDFNHTILNPERIKIEDNILVNGCYGPLYKARFENEEGEWHNLIAKAVEGGSDSETAALTEECLKQVVATKRLQDLNIMSVYGLSKKSGKLYVLETYMREGSLLNYCRKRGQGLQRARMIMLLADVLNGMAYLAEQKVIHKNLCAQKCLVHGELRVKVSDFGLSRNVTGVAWRAPETWEIGAAAEPPLTSTASDVWSYGTLMWEVMSRGEVPFDGESDESIQDRILKRMRLAKPAAAIDADYNMMNKCWMEEPDQRPHFNMMLQYIDEEVRQSPYQSVTQHARV